MPPRRDFSGALHHVIVRGIERRRIFREDADRQLFLNLIDTVCRRFGVSPGALGSRSLRSGVLDAHAVLSYAAVMEHGLSLTAVARQVGLSRRSISRAITRAQMGGLTGMIPGAATVPPTTPP